MPQDTVAKSLIVFMHVLSQRKPYSVSIKKSLLVLANFKLDFKGNYLHVRK